MNETQPQLRRAPFDKLTTAPDVHTYHYPPPVPCAECGGGREDRPPGDGPPLCRLRGIGLDSAGGPARDHAGAAGVLPPREVVRR
jgi:hypothetical protein